MRLLMMMEVVRIQASMTDAADQNVLLRQNNIQVIGLTKKYRHRNLNYIPRKANIVYFKNIMPNLIIFQEMYKIIRPLGIFGILVTFTLQHCNSP